MKFLWSIRLNRLLLLALFSFQVLAKTGGGIKTEPIKWHEADYVVHHCKGEIEHVLLDRTRVDCLTETHAIEYD